MITQVGRALKGYESLCNELYSHILMVNETFPAPGEVQVEFKEGEPGLAEAETLINYPDNAVMTFYPNVFGHAPRDQIKYGFMPSFLGVPEHNYIATHEWGHVLEMNVHPTRVDHLAVTLPGVLPLSFWFQSMPPDMSYYGLMSGREAVAEGFAEWYLTGGHTKNKAAKYIAEIKEWSHIKA